MDFSEIIPALPGLWDGMAMTLQLMALGIIGGVARPLKPPKTNSSL